MKYLLDTDHLSILQRQTRHGKITATLRRTWQIFCHKIYAKERNQNGNSNPQ